VLAVKHRLHEVSLLGDWVTARFVARIWLVVRNLLAGEVIERELGSPLGDGQSRSAEILGGSTLFPLPRLRGSTRIRRGWRLEDHDARRDLVPSFESDGATHFASLERCCGLPEPVAQLSPGSNAKAWPIAREDRGAKRVEVEEALAPSLRCLYVLDEDLEEFLLVAFAIQAYADGRKPGPAVDAIKAGEASRQVTSETSNSRTNLEDGSGHFGRSKRLRNFVAMFFEGDEQGPNANLAAYERRRHRRP
jgi:hypothetical protein